VNKVDEAGKKGLSSWGADPSSRSTRASRRIVGYYGSGMKTVPPKISRRRAYSSGRPAKVFGILLVIGLALVVISSALALSSPAKEKSGRLEIPAGVSKAPPRTNAP